MDQDLEQKVRARMEELPADVRQAILSAELEKKVQAIGGKHRLHINQIGKLEDETLLVMLAFSDPAEFADNLAKQLQVPQEQAEAIAGDVSNEIFVSIRKSMQDFVEGQTMLEALANEPKAPQVTKSVQPPTTPAPAPVPKLPVAPPQLHPADMMLTQKTVTMPPSKPTNYKTDPYREPPEL